MRGVLSWRSVCRGGYPPFEKRSGVSEEGVRVRTPGITAPILLLGATDEDHMDDVIAYDLIPDVFTLETLRLLQEHAQS